MKRETLKAFKGRIRATGCVEKFGMSRAQEKHIPTVLVTDIWLSDGERQCRVDHVWFRLNRMIAGTPFRTGDRIEFSCVVEAYYYAPDFVNIQGYGVGKIREVSFLEKGKGVDLHTFLAPMVKNGQTFLHLA